MRHMLLPAIVLGLLLAPLSARADDQPAQDKTKSKPQVDVIEITIRPAELPRPAMKYRLLPSYIDQTPGNAAALYDRAALILEQSGANAGEFTELLATPKGRLLPPAERKEAIPKARAALEKVQGALSELELASRREHCDWDLPFREFDNVYEVLLPELQSFRNLGRCLALKARLQMAQGDYEGALKTLQTGFALSRHVGEQPILISGLVGYAIYGLMADELLNLIDSTDVPNLYWTIANLPQPIFALRRSFEIEGDLVYLAFPELRDARRQKHTPQEWEALLARFIERVRSVTQSLGGSTADELKLPEGSPQELVKKLYPLARRELIARGCPETKVDAMPPAQVVLLNTCQSWDEIRDEVFKWFALPYWQAAEGMKDTDQKVNAMSERMEVVPLARTLLPAVSAARMAQTRIERVPASLRLIEAIRLYAARHQNKLPQRLADITEVPLPLNPFTGKDFDYHLEGDTAVLDAKGGPYQRQYRLKLAQPAAGRQ